MVGELEEIFANEEIVTRIKSKLPELFQIAQIESSRGGVTGMEVGVLREKILVALLISVFGENNVKTNIETTRSEIDVYLFEEPISIKTVTGNGTGVKAVWTVDQESARRFAQTYSPTCDILLAIINWDSSGGLYYIPLDAQHELLQEMGADTYLKLPRAGTNPRGVEFSRAAIVRLTQHKLSKQIPIEWTQQDLDYDPYKRWVDYWLSG